MWDDISFHIMSEMDLSLDCSNFLVSMGLVSTIELFSIVESHVQQQKETPYPNCLTEDFPLNLADYWHLTYFFEWHKKFKRENGREPDWFLEYSEIIVGDYMLVWKILISQMNANTYIPY